MRASVAASDFSCMSVVWILLSSMTLVLQDVQSYKNKYIYAVPMKVWRTRACEVSQAWGMLFQSDRSKLWDPHTLTLLVINSEIRCWSGDRNVKALLSALGMGSFWSWKTLKGSSSFTPSYFCLSEHKLLQPLPRLLVSERKEKAISI